MNFTATDFEFSVYFHPREMVLADINPFVFSKLPYLLGQSVNLNLAGGKKISSLLTGV